MLRSRLSYPALASATNHLAPGREGLHDSRRDIWIQLLGYDAAVQDKNAGLAWGYVNPGTGVLELGGVRAGRETPVETLLTQRLEESVHTVLAVDAPLGWPLRMAETLAKHRSGEMLGDPAPSGSDGELTADRLFRRETDAVVRRLVARQTLDVGADRIARTAFRALQVLSTLRRTTGRSLPTAVLGSQLISFLQSAVETGPRADAARRDVVLEAYPAGWLAATGRSRPGYRSDAALRRALFRELWQYRSDIRETDSHETDTDEPDVGFPSRLAWEEAVCRNGHVFDAVLCVLIAGDYVAGRCVAPESVGVDAETATREGWIWFPDPR